MVLTIKFRFLQAMFRSILISFVRQFNRNLSLSIISVSGLVIGLTVSILIFLWVTYELSYDRYHPDNERVFAVLSNTTFDGEVETSDEVPIELTDFLMVNVPEVESATRVDGTRGYLGYGDKSVNKSGAYADADYFRVFNVRIVSGSSANLLPDKNSIVISEEIAHLLFEDGDALGKVVSLDLKKEFKVTGVFAGFPVNSTMNAIHYVLPFYSRQRDPEDWRPTYVKLNAATSSQVVEQRIDSKFNELFEEKNTSSLLFCLTDWRLHWSFENGKVSGGRIFYVVVFSITALFILIMACVNYMNISTAGAAKRAREIGVRKVTGATRPALIRLFIFESFAITFLAACASLLLSYFLLPVFNQMAGVELVFSITDPVLVIGLSGITMFTALLAGSYPALLLSALKPAVVLKGSVYSALTGAGLRRSLVAFQFTLSVILIFCTLIIQQQIDLMLKKDLGFDKNNVLIIDVDQQSSIPLNSFKSQLTEGPVVLSAGVGDSSPIEINGAGEVKWVGKAGEQTLSFNGASCDDGYLQTIGLEIVQGRNFSPDVPSDSINFIITQKGAELLGFKDPIGQTIRFDMYHPHDGKIIGVIKDFYNEDIHVLTNPVVFSYQKEKQGARVFVRYQEGKLDDALNHIKAVFNEFQPGVHMRYGFLDRDFENQFYQERLFRKFSVCFTIIGVALACLGLLGLTMFSTQRRAKEIAVRKVLGATIVQIMVLLYQDFGKPIMISLLVAFPIAYYLTMHFLETYPFRIDISILSFIIVGLIMIGVVILTVSFQSLQAAIKNPVDSLKE